MNLQTPLGPFSTKLVCSTTIGSVFNTALLSDVCDETVRAMCLSFDARHVLGQPNKSLSRGQINK